MTLRSEEDRQTFLTDTTALARQKSSLVGPRWTASRKPAVCAGVVKPGNNGASGTIPSPDTESVENP